MARDKYHFFLIGVVGVAALLALLLVMLSYNPGQVNRAGRATTAQAGTYTLQEGETVTVGEALIRLERLDAHSADVLIHDMSSTDALSPGSTEQSRESQQTRELTLGDTVLSMGLALTLYDTSGGRAFLRILPVSDERTCGEETGQTRWCRGSSACCDGECVELPRCATGGGVDGLVMTCGPRQLYCCGGARTFAPCTSGGDVR